MIKTFQFFSKSIEKHPVICRFSVSFPLEMEYIVQSMHVLWGVGCGSKKWRIKKELSTWARSICLKSFLKQQLSLYSHEIRMRRSVIVAEYVNGVLCSFYDCGHSAQCWLTVSLNPELKASKVHFRFFAYYQRTQCYNIQIALLWAPKYCVTDNASK